MESAKSDKANSNIRDRNLKSCTSKMECEILGYLGRYNNGVGFLNETVKKK
jgi:hypothetical protein